jgi:hypothetical protein
MTPRMKDALDAAVAHVAAHGEMPSRRELAQALGVTVATAQSFVNSLIERGELHISGSGTLAGFGSRGVAVVVPGPLASLLAAFCGENAEKIVAVVTDAISLHLDEAAGMVCEPETAHA